MKSTDNNINNPLSKTSIDIKSMIDSVSAGFTTVIIPYFEYVIMQLHDPTVMYVISDSPKGDVYIGDHLCARAKNDRKYLMTYDDLRKDYAVYVNMTDEYIDHLVEICRYKEPQTALDAVITYNMIGGHDEIHLKLHQIITEYIYRELGVNESIIGMISAAGYRDDSRLQIFNQFAVDAKLISDDKTLPSNLFEKICDMSRKAPASLATLYVSLYNTFVRYKFFKAEMYKRKKENDIDLSNEIYSFYTVLNSWKTDNIVYR